jgi:broad specificity phosphatase PhoE
LSSKKIYLIRHGQTDFNLRGIVQGSGVNSSLNDTGRAQAKAFYAKYGEVPFDKIYTSALKRSQESVQSFIDKGISYESLAGLNEISWGTKEGQSITPEEDEYYHYMLRQWHEGNTSLKIEGGESPEDVVDRMRPVIAHIMSRVDEQIILICMHGRAIRILLCYLLNQPLKNMDSFEHQNLGLYLLNYSEGKFSVERNNDTTHLSLSS